MANDLSRSIKIFIDNSDAQAKASQLEAKIAKLNGEMEQLAATGQKDTQAYAQKDKAYKAATGSLEKYKNSLADTTRVLNNLSGATKGELDAVQKALVKDMRDLGRETDEYKAKLKLLHAVEAERAKAIAEMRGENGRQASMWSRMADGINKYSMMAVTGIAALTGITMKLQEYHKASLELEDSKANLQSLTGLDKNRINQLTDDAKQMSTSITADGVRITATAKDIVDGFTVIGSKRPELLKNKDALKAVTQEALTLAAAGKMEAAPAYEAVTASMNQFNLKAEDSRRIINALAAGSLAGSAEIPNLTDSMKNVGTVANDSNLSLEQSVAILEVLASKQLVGEEAGTKLRGALLKLKEAGVGYQSGAFNMRDALVEVNKKMDEQATQAGKDALKIKMFGAENVTAGTILMQNIPMYDEMTKAVTGTNTAIDQARINTGTMNARLAQSRNEMQLAGMALAEKLSPAIYQVTNGTVLFMKALIALPQFLKENWQWIAALSIAIIAYNAALIKSTLVNAYDISLKKLQEIWTNRVTIAQTALNLVLKANPIGLVISLIALLVAGFITWYNHSIKVQAVTQGLFAAIKEMGSKLGEFFVGIWQLISGTATFNPSKIKEGVETLKRSMSQWGDQVADAYQKAYDKRMKDAEKKPATKSTFVMNNGTPTGNTPQGNGNNTTILSDEDKKKAEAAEKRRLESLKKQFDAQLKAIHDQRDALKAADKDLLGDDDVYDARLSKIQDLSDQEVAIIRKKAKNGIITEAEANAEIEKLWADKNKYVKEISSQRVDILLSALKTELEMHRLQEDEILAGKKQTAQSEHELTLKRIEEDRAAEEAAIKERLKYNLIGEKEAQQALRKVNQQARTKTAQENGRYEEAERQRRETNANNDLDNQLEIAQAGETKLWAFNLFSQVKNGQKIRDLKVKQLREQEKKELAQEGLTAEQKANIEEKYNRKVLEITELTQDQKMEIISNSLSSVAGLFAEHTVAYKLLATTQATIDTYVAANKALAAYPPPFGAIAMAGVIASGLANVAKINGIGSNGEASSASGSSSTSTSTRVVNQRADGKYDVFGAKDGRLYRDIPYVGAVGTGIVKQPTLISEYGDEAIIDGVTFGRLQRHINYPLVVQAINDARINKVPQRADGKYDMLDSLSGVYNSVSKSSDIDLVSVLMSMHGLLTHLKENGVNTPPISLKNIKDAQSLQSQAASLGARKKYNNGN